MSQRPVAILRQTSPRLVSAMAFCFGFGWLTWKWDQFGEFMAGKSGHLPTLLPGFAGLALALFFGALAIVNWRRRNIADQTPDP